MESDIRYFDEIYLNSILIYQKSNRFTLQGVDCVRCPAIAKMFQAAQRVATLALLHLNGGSFSPNLKPCQAIRKGASVMSTKLSNRL
jgi:hypothetical protein